MFFRAHARHPGTGSYVNRSAHFIQCRGTGARARERAAAGAGAGAVAGPAKAERRDEKTETETDAAADADAEGESAAERAAEEPEKTLASVHWEDAVLLNSADASASAKSRLRV